MKRLRELGRRGVSAIEFAFVAPVLVTLMVAAADYGGLFQLTMRLETAARAGAQFALAFPNDSAGTLAATAAALPPRLQPGGQTPATITVQCTCGAAIQPCNATCAPTSDLLVSIVVTRPYAPLLLTPFVPSQARGNAIVRVR